MNDRERLIEHNAAAIQRYIAMFGIAAIVTAGMLIDPKINTILLNVASTSAFVLGTVIDLATTEYALSTGKFIEMNTGFSQNPTKKELYGAKNLISDGIITAISAIIPPFGIAQGIIRGYVGLQNIKGVIAEG